jgi:hypothetical protein
VPPVALPPINPAIAPSNNFQANENSSTRSSCSGVGFFKDASHMDAKTKNIVRATTTQNTILKCGGIRMVLRVDGPPPFAISV